MPRTDGNGTGPHPIHVEEPQPEPAATRLAKWLTSWQAIAGVVATVFLAGVGGAVYAGQLAKKVDVAEAIVLHAQQGANARAHLVADVDDHTRRIRLLEDEARDAASDRRWIIRVLDEQRRRQRLDAPEPPARHGPTKVPPKE